MDTREAKQARYEAERDPLLKVFGNTIRALHEERGYTQESFARAANLHPTYIGCLERGEREPRLSIMLILADTLKVPLDRLAQGLPVPKERKPPPLS